MTSLLGHDLSRTYNDRKFCKEPKTIIVVDKWLKSLRAESHAMLHSYIWPNCWPCYHQWSKLASHEHFRFYWAWRIVLYDELSKTKCVYS